MHDRCTVCGQSLPVLDLGDHGHTHTASTPSSPEAGGSRTSVFASAAAALFVVIALVALLSRDNAEPDPVTEPDTSASVDDFVTSPGADDTLSRSDPIGEVVAPTASELTDLLQQHRLAYLVSGAVIVIDPQAALPVLEVPTRIGGTNSYFSTTENYELLHDGERTVGLTPRPSEAVVLSTSGRLVPDGDGGFAVVPDPDGVIDKLLITGRTLLLSGINLPAGSTLLRVDNLGVIVSSAAGTSYLARPGRLDQLGEGLIVAATPTHHVEVRCEDPLDCVNLLVDRVSGAAMELPRNFAHYGRDISLSPNGRWLLSDDPQTAEPPRLFETETQSVTQLTIDIPTDLTWSPDGAVAAWFQPGDTEPLLQIFDPATQSIYAFDLGALGAPARTADSLTIMR
jgi:hypothetical protein